MHNKVTLDLSCPNCGLPVKASVDEHYESFILYVCPKCLKNIVFYENKIDMISDRLFFKLLRSGRVSSCGNLDFGNGIHEKKQPEVKNKPEDRPINEDDVINLKIALETSKDFYELFKKTPKN